MLEFVKLCVHLSKNWHQKRDVTALVPQLLDTEEHSIENILTVIYYLNYYTNAIS